MMTSRGGVALVVLALSGYYGHAAEPLENLKEMTLAVVSAGVPMYPQLARAAGIQGSVHVRIETDGTRVVSAKAEDGGRLLAATAEENARTWVFQQYVPVSTVLTYHYRIDESIGPAELVVKLRPYGQIDVAVAPWPRNADFPGERK